MSREIKFRGKCNDNAVWLYGDLVTDKANRFILRRDASAFDEVDEVRPETVGQFTGLHDKNGVEIYEGDVFQSFYHPEVVFHHTVEWSDRLSGWYCRHEKDTDDKAGNGSAQLWVFLGDKSLHSELIGTIHDKGEA